MKTKNNNIVLIGFMGVGKGTTARALSKALKTMNLDCDDLLESSQNMKIKLSLKSTERSILGSLKRI